ncbi:DUF350 domain-containing protein [Nakamurella endophytica]|uniref:DUF350 domain-containing protein n=1 Tax=Nakamurella endophytica TaxID=1748367 RepID=A0A917SLG6_9ACTN|nr:hypothetical protein [Nakamurella endophytica]GGL86332.1 hypothetical protein GCM10011594_02420 [Nakamurella endophytica]
MIADQTYVLPTWSQYGLAGAKVLLFALFVAGLWELVNVFTRYDDEVELFDRRNVPYAVVRISLVLAQGIAMMPLVGYTTGTFWTEVGTLAGWAAGILVVLLVITVAGDRRLRHRATAESDLGSAIVRGGYVLAAGLVLNAALSGTAPDVGTAIASSIVFAALGIVGLLLAFFVLRIGGLFGRRGTTGRTGLAGGIVSAGVLISLGLVLRTAVAGDFLGWRNGILSFLATFAAGLVGLVVLTWLIDLVLIRSRRLSGIVGRDEALPASVMAGLLVAVSLGISSVVL